MTIEWPSSRKNFYWICSTGKGSLTFGWSPRRSTDFCFGQLVPTDFQRQNQKAELTSICRLHGDDQGNLLTFIKRSEGVDWLLSSAQRIYWLLLRSERPLLTFVQGEGLPTLPDGLRGFTGFQPVSRRQILTFDFGTMPSESTNFCFGAHKVTKTFTGFWFGWTRRRTDLLTFRTARAACGVFWFRCGSKESADSATRTA